MIIPVNAGDKTYDIVLERGAIKKAGEYFGIGEGRKVLIVTDTGVPAEYVSTVAAQFSGSCVFTFPMGEGSKNFGTYREICLKLLSEGFTRKDAVIAVGGGVAGDMAGFAAATYMRGISFYNIPTTLLSQVDSSIGGKTAIDFEGYKNIIGAFHQPEKVIIDPDVLSTLDERQMRNGFAEAIKAGIIMDKELFSIFERGESASSLTEVIERSLAVKRKIVEQDEKETGLRKALNFGHTVGHAIESTAEGFELLHGECVALGMISMCQEAIRERVIAALEKTGLPTSYAFDREKVISALSHDKKSEGKYISVVISKEIGSFEFIKMTTEEITEKI